MRIWNRVAVCAALAACFVIAAGPAAAVAARAAKATGSCKLLTTRQVGRILDEAVGAGKQKTRKGGGQTNDQCVWAAKKKGTGGIKGQPLRLEVVVESGTGLVDDYREAKADDPFETDEVPGLGDDGFIKDLNLHVLVGERVVSVALHHYRYPEPWTQEQIQQKEEDAAKLVLDRLK